MSIWTVILIIAVIAAIILGVLYFVGRKMQAKQEDQRAQLDQMAQTVNMLVIDIAGTQVTNNVELSSHDQLPQFPSSATLNYIFKGNYYAWKSMNVMLRANATGTNAGFTVTGRWNPNAGTAYSGQ